MRAVIQRVARAEVRVHHAITGKIARGLLVLLAVAKEDTDNDLHWLMDKIRSLRIFPNEQGKFDRSVEEIGAEILIVSQFTLYGDCRKGRRPGFDASAPPEIAAPMYERAIAYLREKGIKTEAGIFGAIMEVELLNEGPVTLIIDSPSH
ncbi:MAG: D-tyrosyl-tRNA(Tyr) deacylase [Candidatus Omnitrophota bacterium]|nr:MAG: D-tyrosyl-tRNA(Tyr) deacylase [Candidatus Omnitrophota bacterium]